MFAGFPNEENRKEENEVVSILLKHSPNFNKFYYEEWKIKQIPARWYLIQDLNKKAQSRLYKNGNIKIYWIEFRHLPTTHNITKDSYLFAHELAHIIRLYENKILSLRENFVQNPEFASDFKHIIRHIFEDTAADRLLRTKYNFDLLPHYEEVIGVSRSYLKTLTEEPHGLERTSLLLQLIKERICWNLIQNRDSCARWTEYEDWLCIKFQNVIEERDEILSLIQRIDWDTPDQQRPVFKILVDKCKIQDMVYIEPT